MSLRAVIPLALALLVACKGKERVDDNMKTLGGDPESDPQPDTALGPIADLDSKEVLARTRVARTVTVKHILLGWKELEASYKRRKQEIDPRAKSRTHVDAAKLAQDLASKLRADPQMIHSLAKQFSEDKQMAMLSDPYTLDMNAPFVPEFKKLALRLERGETGIVRTDFGYHVITRLAPVRDPIDSRAILERKEVADEAWVQAILIGYRDTQAARQGRVPDPRARERSRDQAAALATEVLGKIAATDMTKLMREYSEDPGSMDTGAPYEITPESDMVEGLVELALRLKIDEAGIVHSPLGLHVVKRIAPPPPDPLETTEVFARALTFPKVKVVQIQLGWTGGHGHDARGKNRERGALDPLVAKTRARITKGEKFEALMKELSEDRRTAPNASQPNGLPIDITPTAPVVPRLRRLALRLTVGEIGVVKTQYGIHILKRIE